MIRIKTSDYRKVLKSDIENFRKVLVSGAPGIGKSKMLESLVRNEEADTQFDTNESLSSDWVIIEERIYNRGEFAVGIPSIVKDENTGIETTIWTAPEWLIKIKKAQDEGKKVCILFDDFHLLVEELQKPMYEFFESFSLNGFEVDPCSIVILGNYNVEELSMRAEIESPIMGRLHMFYELEPDFKEWAMNVEVNNKLLHYFSMNRGAGKFFTPNPMNTEMYPSPRTICSASRIIDSGHPLQERCLPGILGEVVGTEIVSQWKELGMTFEEMLTPSSDSIENITKTVMLVRAAKLDSKGKDNVFEILKVLDSEVWDSKELALNFFSATMRKFKKDPELKKIVSKMLIECANDTIKKTKKTKSENFQKIEHYNITMKYLKEIDNFAKANNVRGKSK